MGAGHRVYSIKPSCNNIGLIRSTIHKNLAIEHDDNNFTVILTFIYKLEKE